MRAARRVPALLAAVLVATVVTPLATPATASGNGAPPAAKPRASREWQRPATGRLQVRFKAGTGAAAQRAALARVTAKGHAVGVDRRLARLNAAILRVGDARAVQGLLRKDPAVFYVEPESRYEAFAETPSPELVEVGASTLHSAPTPQTGAGTEIAIIDSPVNASNQDLNGPGKVVDAGDFTTPIGLDPEDPWQTTDSACGVLSCPHGTAVATVAAGEADNTNMVGVAPDAVIRSYNVFRLFHYIDPDTEEEGYEVGAASGDIAAALDALTTYAAANQQLVAANMSLGGTFDNHLIRDAIAGLRAAAPQVTVVVAAGNDGAERATFPAGDPGVISVGATGQPLDGNACDATPSGTWTLAGFSNRGDVDVVAPGQCMFAWYTAQAAGGNTPATVQKVDGTSFAAPMVAGTAALLGGATPSVTGDAARAAIVASAKAPTTGTFGNGVGALDAAAALTLAQGTAPYTAAFVERGGHVASNVGRRNVEVLRVDRDGPTPAPATITVPSGNGTLAGLSTQATSTLTRSSVTWFAAPKVNKAGLSFGLTAAGGNGGDDTTVVPFRYLDAADNFEGLPIPNNEQTSVALTYGSRSAYIRSAHVENELDWTFQFDPHGWENTAQLYTWEPTSSDGVADAAFEPTFVAVDEADLYYVIPDLDECDSEGRPCYRGRYLIGWMLGSPDDNSVGTSRYNLRLNYAGPGVTLNAPSLASAVSSTGPFTVNWGGASATTFDVEYTTKTKVGTSWVLGTWKPWLTNTTLKSKVFGASNSPVALAKGQTYHFRLRSYDQWLNPSPYVTKYTVVPLDDAYYAFAYAGTWGKGGATGRWASNVHYSSTAGASLTAKSETSQFTVIGDKCVACGQIRVYIDGLLKATVDTRASGTLVRQVLWTSANLGAPKTHTLKVVVVGTAGRPKVVLDAIGSLR